MNLISRPRRVATAAVLAASLSALPVVGLTAPATAAADCSTEQTYVSEATTHNVNARDAYAKAVAEAKRFKGELNTAQIKVVLAHLAVRTARAAYLANPTRENQSFLTTALGNQNDRAYYLEGMKVAYDTAVDARSTTSSELTLAQNVLREEKSALGLCLNPPTINANPQVNAQTQRWTLASPLTISGLPSKSRVRVVLSSTAGDVNTFEQMGGLTPDDKGVVALSREFVFSGSCGAGGGTTTYSVYVSFSNENVEYSGGSKTYQPC